MASLLAQEGLRAGRRLLRSPRHFAVAVLTVAAAVTPTLLFDAVGRAVLPPLPFERSQDLVHVWQVWRHGGTRTATSYPELRHLRERSQTMDVAAQTSAFFTLENAGTRVRIKARAITPNYFDVLRVRPVLGRTFREDENQTPFGHPVVILSETLWRDAMGAMPDIVGQRVSLNGQPFSVIGVAPAVRERFWGRDLSAAAWIPAMMAPSGMLTDKARETATVVESPDAGIWLGVARLRGGHGLRQARAEASRLAREVRVRWPHDEADVPFDVVRMSEDAVSGNVLRAIAIVKVAGLFVLLVGAINLASLFVARGLDRAPMLGVQELLGAPPAVLLWASVAEGLWIGIAGAVTALLLTHGTVLVLGALDPTLLTTPMGHVFDPQGWSIGARVVGLGFALSMVTSVTCAAAAAIRAARGEAAAFRQRGAGIFTGGLRRLRPTKPAGMLAVAEITAAVALTLPAVLLALTVGRLVTDDMGFRPGGVMTAELALPAAAYPDATIAGAISRVTDELERVSGVHTASWVSCVPIQCGFFTGRVSAAGSTDKGIEAAMLVVAPRSFRTLGIPVREGRDFGEADGPQAPPVAILSEQAAHLLGSVRAGARLKAQGHVVEVVGIVGDVPHRELSSAPMPAVYYPLSQRPQAEGVVVLRSSRADGDMAASLRAALGPIERGLGERLAISALGTRVEREVARFRNAASLLGAASLLAVFLSAIGVYGLMSSFVARARPEIGLRMALGATRAGVGTAIVTAMARLLALGASAGTTLGMYGAYHLRAYLAGVQPWDAAGLVVTLLVAALLAFAAAYGPTIGALRTDPMRVLRCP